jgi:hypothetical protein
METAGHKLQYSGSGHAGQGRGAITQKGVRAIYLGGREGNPKYGVGYVLLR